jgi:hypothetical protein
MTVNTAKTKFIVFWTRENRIDPNDCRLVINSNESGKTEVLNLSLKFLTYITKAKK